MAFGNFATGTTTISLTGVTAGATICVFPTDLNGNATAFTVSDGDGSYSARGNIIGTSGDTSTQLLIRTGASAGTHTISLAATGDSIVGGLAFWYTGVGDVDNGHAAINGASVTMTATANSGASGSFTTTSVNAVIIGVSVNQLTTAAPTVGTSPFTFVSEASGSIASTNGFLVEDFTWSSSGSTSVAAQYASGSHLTSVIGFALAPTGGTPVLGTTPVRMAMPKGMHLGTPFSRLRAPWLGNTAPTTNVTVALVGQSATFTAGTLTPSTTVALTGQSATFTAGTLSPALSVALLGQAATFSSGTLTPNLAVALLGQQAVFTAGTLSPSMSVALTGQPAVFTAGTLSPALALALAGQSASFASGTLTPGLAVALLGQQAVFTPGNVVPPFIAVTGTFSLVGIDATLIFLGPVSSFSDWKDGFSWHWGW